MSHIETAHLFETGELRSLTNRYESTSGGLIAGLFPQSFVECSKQNVI